MPRISILLVFLIISVTVFGQDSKIVKCQYTYYAPESLSLEQAKENAINRAKIQAIADEFGTIVSQSNYTNVNNRNGESNIDFHSIGISDVRGEWIETIGSPKFEILYENDLLVISVHLSGKIREIVGPKVDLLVKVLRNGAEDKYESSEFRNGDDLYVSFQSPISGFIAIYLIDNEGNAYCLLPYRRQKNGVYAIEANKRYIFFSKKNAASDERQLVDEYVITANQNEVNQIVTIFSPHTFSKAIDFEYSSRMPRSCSSQELNNWLTNVRKFDNSVQVTYTKISLF